MLPMKKLPTAMTIAICPMDTLMMLAIRTYRTQTASTMRKTFSGRLNFFIVNSCVPSWREQDWQPVISRLIIWSMVHGVQHDKNAEGGTRTHTSLRRADFKSAARSEENT